MSNVGAPDSWEQEADATPAENTDSKEISTKFSTLNVNAAEFVPSFSYTLPAQESAKDSSPEKAESPVTNGK